MTLSHVARMESSPREARLTHGAVGMSSLACVCPRAPSAARDRLLLAQRGHSSVLALWLNDAITDRKPNDISKRGQFKLAHDRRPMRLNGFDAQVQTRRDSFVAVAFRQQLNDLTLARGQPIRRDGRRSGRLTFEVALQNNRRHPAGEVGHMAR